MLTLEDCSDSTLTVTLVFAMPSSSIIPQEDQDKVCSIKLCILTLRKLNAPYPSTNANGKCSGTIFLENLTPLVHLEIVKDVTSNIALRVRNFSGNRGITKKK